MEPDLSMSRPTTVGTLRTIEDPTAEANDITILLNIIETNVIQKQKKFNRHHKQFCVFCKLLFFLELLGSIGRGKKA